jgi:hypothetical protein
VRRRTVLAALGTAPVALAGCVSGGGVDDCGNATRAEPSGDSKPDGVAGPVCVHESEDIVCRDEDGNTHEFETAEPVPYPDPPAAVIEAAVVEYVETFERAYVTHQAICGSSSYVTGVFASIHRSETLDLYEDRTAVFLLRSGGATSGVGEGVPWEAAAAPPRGVVYAVDAAGADRVAFDTERLQNGEYRDPAEMDTDTIAARAPDPVERGERVVTFE